MPLVETYPDNPIRLVSCLVISMCKKSLVYNLLLCNKWTLAKYLRSLSIHQNTSMTVERGLAREISHRRLRSLDFIMSHNTTPKMV